MLSLSRKHFFQNPNQINLHIEFFFSSSFLSEIFLLIFSCWFFSWYFLILCFCFSHLIAYYFPQRKKNYPINAVFQLFKIEINYGIWFWYQIWRNRNEKKIKAKTTITLLQSFPRAFLSGVIHVVKTRLASPISVYRLINSLLYYFVKKINVKTIFKTHLHNF